MKRAIVTGITGFLGSHIVRKLVKEGWQVVGLKRSTSDLFRLTDIADKLRFYDVDQIAISEVFKAESKISAVLHFATDYGRSGLKPSRLLKTNTLLPLELLEQAIAGGIEVFINADTCYTLDYKHLQAYTLSKKQFAQWGEQLSSDMKFLNLILQHPYGPFDAPSKFVPYIIRECLIPNNVIPLTAGEQRKDFVYVDDVVEAVMLLLCKSVEFQMGYSEWECGTGCAITIREFVETVHQITESTALLKFGTLPYRENEIMFSQANLLRLATLGWKSQVSVVDGIQRMLMLDRNQQH